MVKPRRDPSVPRRCSTKGCTESPMYEVQIQGAGAEYSTYYSCRTYFKEWLAYLGPEDWIQYLGETAYDRMNAQAEEYRAMMARGIDPAEF